MPCSIILVTLAAMWTMQAFQSPGTKPGDLAGHGLTRPEGLVLCLSLIFRQLERDPGGEAGHSASSRFVDLIPHLARNPDGPSPWVEYNSRSVFKRSKPGLKSVFFLKDWLSYQDKRTQSVRLGTQSWRK